MTTSEYGAQFSDALSFGRTIGLTRAPRVDEQSIVPARLEAANELIREKAEQWRAGLPTYHGDQCMEITSRLYALLNSHGVAAEIVIGSVAVHEAELYSITPEQIAKELTSPGDESTGLNLHAWLSIGGDSIIDYALPSLLVKKMDAPSHFWRAGFVESAADMHRQRIVYTPMLVGAEFIGRVNTHDPHELYEHIRKLDLGR